jgi:peptidoglycan/LPS O-acetylase OafA/YrhL
VDVRAVALRKLPLKPRLQVIEECDLIAQGKAFRACAGGRVHWPGLDGLRALAVLAVIADHANILFGGETASGWCGGLLGRGFGAGWIGVDLFFCLSGFLITSILWQAREDGHYFRNFYGRRALRIAPLYYGFVLLVFLVIYRLPMAPHAGSCGDWLAALLYGNNIRYAATGVAAPHLGHFWSLAVEEHFYLLWPFAVRFIPRRRLISLCLAGAACSLLMRLLFIGSGAWTFSVYLLTPCRLDGLLLGSLVALARPVPAEWVRLRRAAAWGIPIAGVVLLGIVAGQHQFSAAPRGMDLRLQMTIGLSALAVLFSALIASAVDGGQSRWKNVLVNPWLRRIGKYSYAMYVFHPLITSTTKWLVDNRLGVLARMSPSLGKPLAVIWVASVSFAAAALSYHLFEKHFLRMQRFFASDARIPLPGPVGRSLVRGEERSICC